ncbi:MAG: acyl-CoA dehydrogenase [Alphaproteobacteria bacterium]|nr:acyl-CoA dehydrogenase [Alphaproteobacteria bacterium]
MTDYTPPLRDLQFVLDELIGLNTIATLPGWAEIGSDDVAAILGQAGRFAAEVMAPLNRTGDLEGSRLENGAVTTPAGFKDAYAAFVEGGWCMIAAEEEHGGMGLPRLVATAVWEMWNSANMALTLCPLLTEGAATLLAEHGNAQQKDYYLPKLVSGEWTGAMVITEPQAGSNVGAIACKAIPAEGGEYRLKGQKIFISWGEHDLTDNIVHLVLARIEGAPEGNRGLSLFLVPKFLPGTDGTTGARNDMRAIALEEKMGIHASPTCVMAYGENEGATCWLIGEENKGLMGMFTMMNAARMAVGHEGIGVAERAYQAAVSYARERLQGPDPDGDGKSQMAIIRHADVRRMLLSMKARVEAMRAVALEAALSVDLAARHPDAEVRAMHEARVGIFTPIIKAWCTDGAVEVASTAIQIHGGAGFIEESGVAQYLRDVRITPIYEGTNGIQALDLVRRKLAGDAGLAIGGMIEEMREFDGALGDMCERGDSEALVVIRGRLAEAGSALARTTHRLLDTAHHAPELADAGAVPYLDLFGTTLGGYLMARAALIAQSRLAEGADEDGFYAAKLATAEYYAAAILPRTAALEHAALGGAAAVFGVNEHEF